jgi:hypothetical protein
MITTDSITRELNAQIAWEIPFPAGGFETDAERSAFILRREARQFELVFQFQKILDLYFQNDAQRRMFLAAYRLKASQIKRQIAPPPVRLDPREEEETDWEAFLKEIHDPRFREPTDEEIAMFEAGRREDEDLFEDQD